MLRESDNSMTSIGPTAITHPGSTGKRPTAMPEFRATGGQQTGTMYADSAISVIPTVPAGLLPDATAGCTSQSGQSLSASQWKLLERGIRQRFEAVSACLDEIVRLRSVPAFLKQCPFLTAQIGSMLTPLSEMSRSDIAWTWLGSTDVHFSCSGELTVLDHNFSLPTGMDCLVVNNDAVALRDDLFPCAASDASLNAMTDTAVLTPGFYSSTFRENEFLARCLNAHLARSCDLAVKNDGVFLQHGGKLTRISRIVRRIDDDLIDPNCFRPDSLVGVPGLVRAWKNGLVTVVNPPGSGFANARSFGQYIPQMIREWLGEEPLLESARVLECDDPEVLRTIMANVRSYVIRTNDPLHPARPFFGSTGTAFEFADLLRRIRANPSAYVARRLLPGLEDPGVNLRLYATLGRRFRLARSCIRRACQPDGGAPLSIGPDETISVMSAFQDRGRS